jgi:basic amino acid/polyamine antiporter, APA family
VSDVLDQPQAQLEREAADSGLFIRKSSGLVRAMGVRDTFSVNIGLLNIVAVGLTNFFALALFPGADLTVPFIISGVANIFVVLTYAQLTMSIPRAGGDYVFIGRIFHPLLGAMLGVAFLLNTMLFVGTIGAVIAQVYLPFAFGAIGQALHSSTIAGWGDSVNHGGGAFAVAAGSIVFTALIALRGVRALTRGAWIAFVFGAIGFGLVILLAFIHSNADFIHAFNDHAGPNGYDKFIAAAHSAGLPNSVSSSATISCLPFVAMSFVGLTWANYAGSEIRRPARTYTFGTLTCLGAGFVFLLLSWLSMKALGGLQFTQGLGVLSGTDKLASLGGGIQAYSPYFSLWVSHDPITPLVMGIGILVGGFGALFAMVLVMSRLIFALSFDRLLPSKMADVGERSHAPTTAIVSGCLVALLFAYLTINTSVLTSSRNFIVMITAVFTVASLAATLMPWLRRDLYESSPKLAKGKWLGLPPVTVVGAVSTVFNGALFYLTTTQANLSGGYDTTSVLTLVGALALGPILYLVSRVFFRGRGIDIALATRELPPN